MVYPSFYYKLYFRLVNYILDHIKLEPKVSSQNHCFSKKKSAKHFLNHESNSKNKNKQIQINALDLQKNEL